MNSVKWIMQMASVDTRGMILVSNVRVDVLTKEPQLWS
jgi:hypothetical protein